MARSLTQKRAGNSKLKTVPRSPRKAISKAAISSSKKTLRLNPKKPIASQQTQFLHRPMLDRSKKLGTFITLDSYGEGEAIRMLLYHQKILYDMVIVSPEQV